MRTYDLAKIIYDKYTIADIKKELYEKYNKNPTKLNKTSLSLLLAFLRQKEVKNE